MIRIWINGDNGPFCARCNHFTYITHTEDGFPIAVCGWHLIGAFEKDYYDSINEHWEPQPLAGIMANALAKYPEDGAWYLPKFPPEYLPNELNDDGSILTSTIGEQYANCDEMTEEQIREMLLDGLREYEENTTGIVDLWDMRPRNVLPVRKKSLIDRIIDWLI